MIPWWGWLLIGASWPFVVAPTALVVGYILLLRSDLDGRW